MSAAAPSGAPAVAAPPQATQGPAYEGSLAAQHGVLQQPSRQRSASSDRSGSGSDGASQTEQRSVVSTLDGGGSDVDCDGLRERAGCSPRHPCRAGCGMCAFVALAILCLFCLDSVPPLYAGITYNNFNKVAHTDRVYSPGRYFIGPFNRFLLFPTTAQNIEFNRAGDTIEAVGARSPPLTTRTEDGLSLDLQVSLQYKLQFENIGTLYHDFNMNYEQVFSGKVRSILINSAAQYRATELWMKRAQVGKHLQDNVDAELKNIYASCWGLQLMIIDLPDNFEEKLIRTEVQNQEILMRKKEQVAKNITAETSVIEACYARQATVMVSKGQAKYSVVTQEAAARAKQKVLETEAEVSSILRSALGLRGEDLVRYQVYDALADKEESHFFFGFGGASVMSKGR